jgi:hypothetical protein
MYEYIVAQRRLSNNTERHHIQLGRVRKILGRCRFGEADSPMSDNKFVVSSVAASSSSPTFSSSDRPLLVHLQGAVVLYQPFLRPFHLVQLQREIRTANHARNRTASVDRTEIMQVRNVIVDTSQPNGFDLRSQRSAQCGQIPGFNAGARMGIR